MNWHQLEGEWKEFAGSARAHWSRLTEDDWRTITGKKEPLVECVQKRYGIAKEEAEKQVDQWSCALQDIAEASRTH
jgi:uncharacterized protein YjbJ (UPF0337 family)